MTISEPIASDVASAIAADVAGGDGFAPNLIPDTVRS